MVVVDSPAYKILPPHTPSSDKMREICRQYGAAFIDNSQMPFFHRHPEYFYDEFHLNAIGAPVYTKMFVGQIKTML